MPRNSADGVEVLERRTLYDGYLRVDVYRLRHRRYGGGRTGTITRELVAFGHAVGVLPYDPVRDEVILIEQFRVGAFAADRPPWQVGIVAGMIEDGETPEAVARRESEEEAGCVLGALEPVCEVMTSPGVLSETIRIYCGRADTAGAGGVFGLAEEQEDIRAFVVPAEEAFAMVEAGQVLHSPAVIALQWLALNRVRLRALWNGTENRT